MPVLAALSVVVLVAGVIGAVLVRHAFDHAPEYLSTAGWPKTGQGAYRLGDETPHASADQQPAPIASLAKVMTALVVLEDLPLHGHATGPTFVVTQQDVKDTALRRSRDESLVPVRAGERLTERDALMALMLPSANNIAVLLAREVSGSVQAFVTEMNRMAHGLGMDDTTYTDPSGFDPKTVSTAADQLRLAEVAADNATLSEIMATSSYRLPVGGTVHNTDTLLNKDGFVGMKTGSDDAAGGCFMFRVYRSVSGFNVELIGVVLGQRGDDIIAAALEAARQVADRVAPDPVHP